MRKFFQDLNQDYLETRSSTRERLVGVDYPEKDIIGHAVGFGRASHVYLGPLTYNPTFCWAVLYRFPTLVRLCMWLFLR